MPVIDISYSKIIHRNRQHNEKTAFSHAEFLYVAQHPDLGEAEKLIWLMLAEKSAGDPHFKCNLSDYEISSLTGTALEAVSERMKCLEKLGFIEIYNTDFFRPCYKLLLPDDGILEVAENNLLKSNAHSFKLPFQWRRKIKLATRRMITHCQHPSRIKIFKKIKLFDRNLKNSTHRYSSLNSEWKKGL